MCFQFTHFLCDDWDNIYIYILCLIIIIKSEVWTITHCLGLVHEAMVRAVCLSIFLWICDMAGLLHGIFVSWWYLPRMWPSVIDMQHYCHARYPIDDWQRSLSGRRVSPCCWHKATSLRQGLCLLTLASLLTKQKQNRTGVTQLSTWTKRGGHLNWRTGLRALLGGKLGGWIVFFLFNCTVYRVCHRQNALWP